MAKILIGHFDNKYSVHPQDHSNMFLQLRTEPLTMKGTAMTTIEISRKILYI